MHYIMKSTAIYFRPPLTNYCLFSSQPTTYHYCGPAPVSSVPLLSKQIKHGHAPPLPTAETSAGDATLGWRLVMACGEKHTRRGRHASGAAVVEGLVNALHYEKHCNLLSPTTYKLLPLLLPAYYVPLLRPGACLFRSASLEADKARPCTSTSHCRDLCW